MAGGTLNQICKLVLRLIEGAAVTDRHVITYIRVSTSQQGRTGVGIEAQRQALKHFASSEGFTVAREFVEVEAGKGSDALDRSPHVDAGLV